MADDTIALPATQQIAVIQPSRLPWNPAFAERYGIEPSAWKALVEAVFPAAQSADSVALALSYCKARRLDPFKRVVHIVPVWDEERRQMVETVWPGIAEHRTTAMRTGLYAGADPASYGDEIERKFSGKTQKGAVEASVRFPKWCQITVYRLTAGQRVPVPGPRVYWEETYSQIGRTGVPNQRWQRAPFQMIEKCAEAAALRRAFPEELGEEATAEESRFTIEQPPRSRYGRADAFVHEPEPQRTAITQTSRSYAVVDADGEEHEFETPAAVDKALRTIFDDAKKRNGSALAAAAENNAAAIRALSDDGHAELAEQLTAYWRELSTDSDPFGLPPLKTEPSEPRPRDPDWWARERLTIDWSDKKAGQFEMRERLREARSVIDVQALRDDNGELIDMLPKATRQDVLAALMDREKQLTAAAEAA